MLKRGEINAKFFVYSLFLIIVGLSYTTAQLGQLGVPGEGDAGCPQLSSPLQKEGCTYTPIYDNNKCIVGYDEKCVPCPQFSPPAPDWCKYGKIISGGVDENGCQLPPKCVLIKCPDLSPEECLNYDNCELVKSRKQKQRCVEKFICPIPECAAPPEGCWYEGGKDSRGCPTCGKLVCQTSITVLFPNGGERWVIGATETIQWSSSGAPDGAWVALFLRGPSTFMIRQGLATSGSFRYTIPETYCAGDVCGYKFESGKDYKIEARLYSGPPLCLGECLPTYRNPTLLVSGLSDAPFSIVSATSRACIDSDGLDYYTKGETKTCDFTTYEEPGSKSPIGCVLHNDLCGSESNVLWEYYCEGDDFKFEKYTCPNGCKDGACLTGKQPSVTALYPSSGPIITQVTISGSGFTPKNNLIKFGMISIPGLSSSDGKTLAFNVPNSGPSGCALDGSICTMDINDITPGNTYKVTVANANGISNNLLFSVTQPNLTEKCKIGGCSGELCGETSFIDQVASPCMYKPEYACYKEFGRCERQSPGQCGWTQTKELIKCIEEKRKCAQENEFCGGIAGITCCSGLTCKLARNYPDAGGVCIKVEKNLPPVISGVSGPTTLKVGETGTWTVKASDPEQKPLSYSVVWGDEPKFGYAEQSPIASTLYPQEVAFTHSYANAGVYTPTFTVTDSGGLFAKTSISVNVGGIAECQTDGDCPPIYCITSPCPQNKCINGKCVISTCGNNICEEGEKQCTTVCYACDPLPPGKGTTKCPPGGSGCEEICTYTCPQDCQKKEIEVKVPSSFSLSEGQAARVVNYQDMRITLNKIIVVESIEAAPPPPFVTITVSLPGGCGPNADPGCLGPPGFSQDYTISQGETADVQGLKITFNGIAYGDDFSKEKPATILATFEISTQVICPKIYAPVCGTDGRTYGNSCEAKAAGVEIAYEGECKPRVCPKDVYSYPEYNCPIYECVPGAVSVQNPTTCCYECKKIDCTQLSPEECGKYDNCQLLKNRKQKQRCVEKPVT